jgi:hypothetical protein
MRLASILSDHPLGTRKRIEVGTTFPAEPDIGWVYVSAVDRERYETFGAVAGSITEHLSPARARELAYALLDAATVASDDLVRQQVQEYINQF